MARGKTKAREEWLQKEVDGIQVGLFLKLVEGDNYSIHCKLCAKQFQVLHQGRKAVEQHLKGKVHNRNFQQRYFGTNIEHLVPEPVNENPDLNANENVIDVNNPQPSCSGTGAQARKRPFNFSEEDDPDDPPPIPEDDAEEHAHAALEQVPGNRVIQDDNARTADSNNNAPGIKLF